jgi:hypothetical protein
MGRPSSYTEEVAQAICERIANGESLNAICREDEMPNKTTVHRWLQDVEPFRNRYVQARERQADHYADAVVEISDDGTIDPNSRRVMIDARKWVAGKLRPKVYGEKTTIAGDADSPLTVKVESITRTIVDPLAPTT